MTRCEAYWKKVRKLLAEDNEEALVEFCKKSPSMIRRIVDHIEYEDKHLDYVPIGTFSETATRPLRTLEKKDSEMHDEALELVINEGIEPKKAVAKVKRKKRQKEYEFNGGNKLVCDTIHNLSKYLKPASVDLILTDPPYPAAYLDLWEVLAEQASIVLKEDGALVTYSGQFYIPEVLRSLSKHLEYYWTFGLMLEGKQNRVEMRNVWNGWKPIFVYVKDVDIFRKKGLWMPDFLISPAPEKEAHEWQQNIQPIKELIEAFTVKGQLVIDPFHGSGTTGIAAEKLEREYFGMDIDKDVIPND